MPVDLDRLWSKWRLAGARPAFTRLELATLYKQFLKRCEEEGIDPETIDFEHEVDSSLTYYENLSHLETLIIKKMPAPPPELEEVIYYKRRAEELEKEIAKLEKVMPIEEIEKLRREVAKYKELAEARTKEIERIREGRPPAGVTKEEIAEIMKPVADALKALLARVRAVEERVVAPPFEIPPVPIVRMPMVEVEEKPVIDFRKIGPEVEALAREKYGKEAHELTPDEADVVYREALEIWRERAYTMRAPMVESALKNVQYLDRGTVKFLFPETGGYWDPIMRAENYPWTEEPHMRIYKYMVVKKLISRDDLVSLGIPEEWVDGALARADRDLKEHGMPAEML